MVATALSLDIGRWIDGAANQSANEDHSLPTGAGRSQRGGGGQTTHRFPPPPSLLPLTNVLTGTTVIGFDRRKLSIPLETRTNDCSHHFNPPPPSHTVFVESTRPGEDGGTEFPGRGGRNFLRTRVDQTRQFCVNNKRFGGALSNTFANSNGAAQLGPRFGQSVPVINLKDRNYLRILKKNSFSEKWWKSFFVIFLRSFNKESI